MGKAIVFTSGKGGVGKTTVTLCVGKAIAREGKRVALVDADAGLNNLDILLGAERSIVFDLSDVEAGRCRLKQALVSCGDLYLLSCGDNGNLDAKFLKTSVEELKRYFDYVLIDCPAGIEYGFYRCALASDSAVVVTSAHLSALKDAAKVITLIKSYGKDATMIINRMRGDFLLDGGITVEEIRESLGADVIGILPENDDLNKISGGESEVSGEGAAAVKMIADNITCGSRNLFDVTKRYRGIFGGIKRRLKRL